MVAMCVVFCNVSSRVDCTVLSEATSDDSGAGGGVIASIRETAEDADNDSGGPAPAALARAVGPAVKAANLDKRLI